MVDYVKSTINRAADKRVNQVLLMNKRCNEFSDVAIPGIPRKVAHALQESLKEEMENWQKQQIIVSLGVDETSEWCISFVLVPKANGKV